MSPVSGRESELRAKGTASAQALKRSGLACSKARDTDRGEWTGLDNTAAAIAGSLTHAPTRL